MDKCSPKILSISINFSSVFTKLNISTLLIENSLNTIQLNDLFDLKVPYSFIFINFKKWFSITCNRAISIFNNSSTCNRSTNSFLKNISNIWETTKFNTSVPNLAMICMKLLLYISLCLNPRTFSSINYSFTKVIISYTLYTLDY